MGTQEQEEKLKEIDAGSGCDQLKEEMSKLQLSRRWSDSLSLLQSHGPQLKILQAMANAVHILDPEYRIIYWNPGAKNLYGFAAQEVLGKDAIEVLAEPNEHSLAYTLANRVKMGESWIGGFPVKDKMQNRFVALFTTTPLYDDYGTLAGLICVSIDSRALKMPISNLAPKVSTQLVKSEYSTCWSSFNVNRRSSISICGSGSSSSANNKVEVDKDRLVYEILWEDLTVKESIGEGSCGTVYHAVLYGSDVAVKVFSKQEYSDDLIKSFEQEVSLIARLRHPNILLFMGAVASPQRLCIVTEFLRRGSLFHLLHRNTAKPDWRRRRFQMAIDIAQGVNYLHHCRPPIVHRDLKSPNILIDKNWTVKVGDFGLSRIKHATYLTTTGKGTPQWMAPEVICHEPSNEKSDVYSFGVIMWELATGKIPWDTFDPMEVMAFVGMMDRRLDIPYDVDPQWASIIESCWHRDPASRPTFQELLERLKELQIQHAIQSQAAKGTQNES